MRLNPCASTTVTGNGRVWFSKFFGTVVLVNGDFYHTYQLLLLDARFWNVFRMARFISISRCICLRRLFHDVVLLCWNDFWRFDAFFFFGLRFGGCAAFHSFRGHPFGRWSNACNSSRVHFLGVTGDSVWTFGLLIFPCRWVSSWQARHKVTRSDSFSWNNRAYVRWCTCKSVSFWHKIHWWLSRLSICDRSSFQWSDWRYTVRYANLEPWTALTSLYCVCNTEFNGSCIAWNGWI